MSGDPNERISRLLSEINRIVITVAAPFNPKNKKHNDVLADIRDVAVLEQAKEVFLVDPNSSQGSWMSPVDVYISFLNGKSLVGSVGVVLNNWFRCEGWEGDYAVAHSEAFQHWLLDCQRSQKSSVGPSNCGGSNLI